MWILSVRLSVTTRWFTKPRWDRDSGSSPYDSLESLVSNEVICCCWVRRFPSNEGIKEGYPLRNRYFTTIGSPSVKTVADRRRLAVYHNKHCRRAFQWYQHRWPWMTLNPQNRGFSEFLAILRCNTHLRLNCAETVQDRPGQPAYEMLSIKRKFQRCKVWPPRFKESSIRAHQIWVPPWKRAISATVD